VLPAAWWRPLQLHLREARLALHRNRIATRIISPTKVRLSGGAIEWNEGIVAANLCYRQFLTKWFFNGGFEYEREPSGENR